MTFLQSSGADSTLLGIFRKSPETARPLIEYHEALMRGPSPFTAGERELIAAYVSSLNACAYCHGVHRATAERFGVAENLLQDLNEDLDDAEIDEKLKPVLHYVRKLTKTPSKMTQADADAVFAAGWDDRALHDAVAVCAVFNMMNRIVEGLGVEADAAYFQESSQRLRENGYLAVIKAMEQS